MGAIREFSINSAACIHVMACMPPTFSYRQVGGTGTHAWHSQCWVPVQPPYPCVGAGPSKGVGTFSLRAPDPPRARRQFPPLTRDSESLVPLVRLARRRAMDAALAAALLPLAPSPRLAGLEARLTASGVTDIRVLSELLRKDAYEVFADFLNLEEAFTEAELALLEHLRGVRGSRQAAGRGRHEDGAEGIVA